MPQQFPFYVLVEAMGSEAALVENALAEALEQALVVDAVIAQSETQRRQLWAMRDDVAQCFRDGPTLSFDVSMPVPDMESYVNAVTARLDASFDRHRCYIFGHMGDGNLHFVIGAGTPTPDVRHAVEAAVYEPLRPIGGSVSAEHGVGLEKKPWLDVSRSANEIALMRTVKRALDPKGILNPGKIFDPVG